MIQALEMCSITNSVSYPNESGLNPMTRAVATIPLTTSIVRSDGVTFESVKIESRPAPHG